MGVEIVEARGVSRPLPVQEFTDWTLARIASHGCLEAPAAEGFDAEAFDAAQPAAFTA
jgi:hypothetical protein